MECQDCLDLEASFLAVRRQWLKQLQQGKITPEESDNLSRAEVDALLALMDHRVRHATGKRADFPAARNMGGIIAPY